jgi:cytochrome c biogenesis protein ResB
LFVVLVSATLGSADKQTLNMTLHEGGTESVAEKEDGTPVETGLSVRLDDFIMETYPSGMPKRFASEVVVKGKSGEDVPAVIEVNNPLKMDGWKMYQYDYDSEAGVESRISVLQLVRDPWLPAVYTGIFMMLAGAFVMMIVGFKKEEK